MKTHIEQCAEMLQDNPQAVWFLIIISVVLMIIVVILSRFIK